MSLVTVNVEDMKTQFVFIVIMVPHGIKKLLKKVHQKELQKKVHQKERLKESSSDDKLCIVCMEKNINSLILPCKHMHLCHECIEKVETCPYCKSSIDQTIIGIYT